MMKRVLGMAAVVLSLAAAPIFAQPKGDAGHGHDYRTFHADGKVDEGKIEDSFTADLVLYLAGNQYMVMDELIKDFLKKNPDIKTVYVETIPPGQILNQILKPSDIDGKKTAQNPDIYASVNLGHLKKLKEAGVMESYMIYIRNKLELMVAAGNPKGIKGPEDLGRDDIVQSHPNPITEGIFKFYGKEMLQDLKLYDKVGGGKECKGCWAVENKVWFTERHHRETPHRIENGQADVGIVWTTEVVEAKGEGRKIDGVAIPAPYNKEDKAGYAIGSVKTGRNAKNAAAYLDYLKTDAAQNLYAKYGFVKAKPAELELKPL